MFVHYNLTRVLHKEFIRSSMECIPIKMNMKNLMVKIITLSQERPLSGMRDDVAYLITEQLTTSPSKHGNSIGENSFVPVA